MNEIINNKLELLAPAGDEKRLGVALLYGADAVYLAGKSFGMRAACKNFDETELERAVEISHALGRKVYVTLNIFPFDADLDTVDDYLDCLKKIAVDALIISDIGLIKRVAKRTGIPVHVSTQANVTNSDTAKAYADLGAKRIVLARELSLDRIRTMSERLNGALELEAFVHGAMCISYSGRCLLSAYLSGRSANRGECDQTCRMRFTHEKTAEPLEFIEDDGTYIFGGNDLNMIEHLDELRDAGVTSFKIEGRMKSEYYVGCVTGAYRHAVDDLEAGKSFDNSLKFELEKAPNRGYNTGFYFGTPSHSALTPPSYAFCGIVDKDTDRGATVEMRNRFRTGDTLEILSPDRELTGSEIVVPVMKDESGNDITDAKIPVQKLLFEGVRLPEGSMLRRKLDVK